MEPVFIIGVCSLVSLTLTEAGQMEVVKRCYNNHAECFVTNPPRCVSPPDEIYKVVYGAADGKIVELRVVKGKHTPAEMVPEKIEFPDE